MCIISGTETADWLQYVILPYDNGLSELGISKIPIDHNKKDGGCPFYHNTLRSEIVFKTELKSFERQT